MREDFPYDTGRFRTNLFLTCAMFLGFGLPLVMLIPIGPLPLIALIIVAVTSVAVLGVSPLLTSHSIEDGVFVLRQGWYFRTAIALSEIANVEEVPRGPRKVGVFFQPFSEEVHVTSRREGLIALDLASARRFPLVMGKRARRVVFDAVDVERLMERLTPSNRDLSS